MLVGDLPVVEHVAQLFHWAVEEGLFLAGQVCRLGIQQFVPVRFAGEQLAVPVHRAGFEGLLLGIGEFGQAVSDPAQ